MESRLKGLFDLQRFESNDRLSKLIDATESKYMNKVEYLSDADLELVSAAGVSYRRPETENITEE